MNASSAATPQTPVGPPPLEPGALPPPHLFDIVPPLHALLSRLLLPSPGLLHPPGSESTSADANKPHAADDQGASGSGSGPLDIQQLDSAANDIRVRIQKARAAVQELPDIDLTTEEQEVEIAELEDRIARMRGMFRGLKAQTAPDAAPNAATDSQ
jgi:RNA polymerase II transcription mediator complex subunit 9